MKKPLVSVKTDHAPGNRGVLLESNSMSELNHKKVAAQLDAVAEAFMALAGSFRGGGDDEGDTGKPGKVGGPKKRSKASSKVEAGGDEAGEELSVETVREALKGLVAAKGKEVMLEALESVGAGKLADVDETQYVELMEKVKELQEAEEEAEAPAPKKSKKATKAPTLAQVKAAAQALIDADKAAYTKITKKLGKPSDMDADDYAAAIEAYEGAMPEEEEADEDL